LTALTIILIALGLILGFFTRAQAMKKIGHVLLLASLLPILLAVVRDGFLQLPLSQKIKIQLRHIRAVSVRQGVIERILGVGTLVFLSAAEGAATVVFKGVRDPIGLKERIRSAQEGQ
jgi:hypothetical protein